MKEDRHIWEGWHVSDFIEDLKVTFPYKSFESKEELKKWCRDEQPYYKKHIPEVYKHFLNKWQQEHK